MTTGVIIALIGMMALAVVFRLYADARRKRAIAGAAQSFGFHRLTIGEVLPIVSVPLLANPKRKFFVIVRGTLDGHDTGFFDLFVGAGKDWFYQSAVIITNPKVMMPGFQLMSPDWTRILSQRTGGDALDIPGRGEEMGSLRLSSDDPEWARQTISRAAPQFIEKLRKGKWTIEGVQHSLVIYRWGHKIRPRNLREYVREAADLAAEVFSLCS